MSVGAKGLAEMRGEFLQTESDHFKGIRVEDDSTKAGDIRKALAELNRAIEAGVAWGLVVEVSVDKAQGTRANTDIVGASIIKRF